MKDTKIPKNLNSIQKNSKLYSPRLDDDISEYATNSLIMTDCYLTEKNIMQDIQVMEAKIDVDNNHK